MVKMLEGSLAGGQDFRSQSTLINKWHFMFIKYTFIKGIKLSNNDISVKIIFLLHDL